MKALDGPAAVHLLHTAGASTCNEYADKVFIPYINKWSVYWVQKKSIVPLLSQVVTPHLPFKARENMPLGILDIHCKRLQCLQVFARIRFLSENPFQQICADSEVLKLLEHFVVLYYDRKSNLSNVNEARKILFCQKNKPMEALSTFK